MTATADDDEDKIAQAQRLHETVRQLRGRLLNSLAVIDVAVSRLLAAYFCQNAERRNLAFSDVFVSPLRLEYKARLLERIVKKEFAWYLEKDHSQHLFSDLKDLREFRNTLAHATIDVSDKALTKDPKQEIGFVYYKNGERAVKQVTREMADKFEIKANMVHTGMIELGKLMGVKV